jgi:hypothetical protein
MFLKAKAKFSVNFAARRLYQAKGLNRALIACGLTTLAINAARTASTEIIVNLRFIYYIYMYIFINQ